MKRLKLLKIPLTLLLLCSVFLCTVLSPVMAATTAVQAFVAAITQNLVTLPVEISFPEIFPQDIFPLAKTKIAIERQKITLDWSEKSTNVQGVYTLVNPEEFTVKVKIGLPNITPALQVYRNEEIIETSYDARLNAHVWELKLEAKEEVNLKLIYDLENILDEQGLCKTGYRFDPVKTALWAEPASPAFSLALNFQNTHPGQILNLAPHHYRFEGNSLVWEQSPSNEKEDILILANPQEEINSWENILSQTEKTDLRELSTSERNNTAADFLEKKTRDMKNSRDKNLLKLGQAYYLKKAGYSKKALSIYEDLADSDEIYPRIYWELGKTYTKSPHKLLGLLNKISELKIHALLQPWLIVQIPPEKIKFSPPEITIKYTDTNINKKGITIKGYLTDKDGDIDKVTLLYHWEGEETKEIVQQAQQFNYEYEPIYFVPAPGPFKKLYYEIKTIDYRGQESTSGEKEVFYLNEDMLSETFILDGANLIMVDYTPKEQNKLYAWFKSYLNITKELGFVPIEAKSPLFIFMGKNYDFIQDYQGILFMHYTPAPFSPNDTRIAVHRYFLSYWYGPGWNNLPEKEITALGDALMLGKNWYVPLLRYLQQKDDKLFGQLLCKIGEGHSWQEALKETYQLTPFKLVFRTIWNLIGTYVIALLIIITLAWLGKHGFITRIVQKFQSSRFSQK